jgi:glycosyltransferase involved in cell wall biosynthesis
MMPGVHQFVPMLHRGDAVGHHALRLRQVLLERGIPSGLYVETTDPQTAADSEPYERYAEQAQPGDVLVYQFATASHLAPWLLDRTETLVLNYHNVTPPEYYAPWDNGLARHQLAARTHLRTLAPRTKLGVAVSDFNEAELLQAGYERTAVVPPAASVSAPAPWRSPRQSAARWLSVGRLAPNKSLQHAVMALLVARAHDDPGATLDLVGRSVVPSYTAALHRFIDEMGLRQAVTFRGQLDDDGLARAMAEADVLVVASAHEGFGLPVVEAMMLGLPVVANAAGALPDVVGEGGVLVDAADPWALAAAVTRLVSNGDLRAALERGARSQLAALDLDHAAERMADLVSALL